MNCETRKAFLELYLDLVLAHQADYGEVLDQIRLEIEAGVYTRSHQYELAIILRFLKEVQNSQLSAKLQTIIDSLGNLTTGSNRYPLP